MVKNINSVKNLCKNTSKTMCKPIEKLCEKLFNQYFHVEKTFFPQTFSNFLTALSTTPSPLSQINLFHFYTGSTITIINKLEERN